MSSHFCKNIQKKEKTLKIGFFAKTFMGKTNG